MVSPLILLTELLSIFGSEAGFNFCANGLSLLPGKIGEYLRLGYYKATLKSIEPDVAIGFGTFFSKRSAEVGSNVSIGAYCIIGNATIGDGTMIASRVSLLSGKHQHGDLKKGFNNPEPIFEKIKIGCKVWIGEGSIVAADIGANAIVGMGSVVTRSIPVNSIVAGNPARPISKGSDTKPDHDL